MGNRPTSSSPTPPPNDVHVFLWMLALLRRRTQTDPDGAAGTRLRGGKRRRSDAEALQINLCAYEARTLV